jgi:hypothetical protein
VNPLDDPLEVPEVGREITHCGYPGDCGLDPLSAVYLADEDEARRAAEAAQGPQADGAV